MSHMYVHILIRMNNNTAQPISVYNCPVVYVQYIYIYISYAMFIIIY